MTGILKIARALLACTTTLSGLALVVAPVYAQTTTARISGRVIAATGQPASGATITARDTGTNRTTTAVADPTGRYLLSGVRPGTFDVTAAASDGTTTSRRIVVGVGESASLDITFVDAAGAQTSSAADTADEGTEIVVTAARLNESKTSEVATNVSQEQIRSLPQTDRNFLAFAALAPGVVYNDSETDKGFRSGASTASQVNVFVDGVSLKNKLREGGVAGQQNSRGNPFGQLAVQEFRVLTQNYKAEYEQAGAAIITAITKSGTNQFHGEAFGQYTGRGLTETDFFTKRDKLEKPAFTRKQYGISLGGPIIKDRLFFFVTYEGNDQNRAFNVRARGDAASRADFEANSGRRLSDFEGNFISPFRSDFYFGKLTLTPDDRQTFDVSFSRRQERDIQGFGGTTSFEAAENKINKVDTYLFKWAYAGDTFNNELSVSHLDYKFNPTSLNPDLPQFEYDGVITFGGKDSTRREVQQNYSLRNDFTYTGIDGHAIKFGGRIEVTDIEFDNQSFIQPRYSFRRETANGLSFAFPAEARLGLGNSLILASDTQVGLYIQDDWQVTDKLELNLGLRWDYETNGFNNDYITPASAASALRALPPTSYFDPENYISSGNNRKPFARAFAPRFGFSYDVAGDRSTVIFGGLGRYYDRNNFNNTVDEISRALNPVGVFRFSADGSPRSGLPTVRWDPRYLTRQGLIDLRASSASGLPELFAVKNDARPPVNDQASLGIRHRFGIFEASVTASYIRGRNGYTNLFATRLNAGTGNCCDTSPVTPFGYANALIGFDGLDTRYKALYFTLDKNYTEASGWGVNIAYTLSKGEQNGNDLFSLDGVTPDAYGWRDRPGDERHRVVISGQVDLPHGFRFSTLTTLGSGQAYNVTDASNGFDTGKLRVTSAHPVKRCIKGVFAFCEINLTLENRIKLFGNHEASIAIDVLNAFNNNNFSGFDGFFNSNGTPPDPLEPGDIGNSLVTLPRRIQLRASYKF